MSFAPIFKSFEHLRNSQKKRQIGSEQCVNSKHFYRPWICLFLPRAAQMSKWFENWCEPHASNYLVHTKIGIFWIFQVFVLIFFVRAGSRYVSKQLLDSFVQTGVTSTVLFWKFIFMDTVLLSFNKSLKQGSLSVRCTPRHKQAGVAIRCTPSVLLCSAVSFLYNVAGQSDVRVIFIPLAGHHNPRQRTSPFPQNNFVQTPYLSVSYF